ncbi:unnamed protein product, partial [Tetraodon nigroviridis]
IRVGGGLNLNWPSSRRTDIRTEISGHCGVYVTAGLLLGYKTKQG